MPPSPWLSARMATTTYLTVVTSVIVQMTSESTPRISSSVTELMPPLPLTMAFITYMGDVPMSPYTTPSVTSIIAALRCIPEEAFASPERFVETVLISAPSLPDKDLRPSA